MLYRLLSQLLLRRLDPETAHTLAIRSLWAVDVLPGGLRLLGALAGSPDPCLRVQALGMTFPSPLGVAAGVDKDARCFGALAALGFGFVEVGTVTPVPQTGNARPRIFRLPARRALLNQMGFPNQGSRAVAERLRRRRHRRAGSAIVGANVGKNRATPPSQAPDDYRALVRELAGCCDYLAINVSSPNTPGLRELQAPELLCPVVRAMQDELSSAGAKIPLLLKISPDVDGGQLDELADLALELSLDGIIAVNTTLDRSGVEGCAEIVGVHGGGVSGAPLQQRALEVLRRLHARTGNRLVLISVGGIQTAHDAWERIQAGATLLQGYTGFVYEGPCWARRINRGLARRVREEGGASIEDLMRPGTLRSGTPR